jgi:hypothetical protein
VSGRASSPGRENIARRERARTARDAEWAVIGIQAEYLDGKNAGAKQPAWHKPWQNSIEPPRIYGCIVGLAKEGPAHVIPPTSSKSIGYSIRGNVQWNVE